MPIALLVPERPSPSSRQQPPEQGWVPTCCPDAYQQAERRQWDPRDPAQGPGTTLPKQGQLLQCAYACLSVKQELLKDSDCFDVTWYAAKRKIKIHIKLDFHSSKPFQMKEAKPFKRCLLWLGIIGSSLIWLTVKLKSYGTASSVFCSFQSY